MKNSSRVRVAWTNQKGTTRPWGDRYITVAKFPEDGASWPVDAWSVVLEFPAGTAQQDMFEAKARFLLEDAPWERLSAGREFELYEGRRLAAKVSVL
jgi:hypothetical protein